MRGKGLFGMRVKLARTGVTFDDGVELPCVEGLKPRAKPRQFLRGELINNKNTIAFIRRNRDELKRMREVKPEPIRPSTLPSVNNFRL